MYRDIVILREKGGTWRSLYSAGFNFSSLPMVLGTSHDAFDDIDLLIPTNFDLERAARLEPTRLSQNTKRSAQNIMKTPSLQLHAANNFSPCTVLGAIKMVSITQLITIERPL